MGLRAHRIVQRYQLMQTWPKAPAVMTKSFLRVFEDSDGISYTPELDFAYSVDGIEYHSVEHTHGRSLNNTTEEMRKLVEKFPLGSIVHVAINPRDPSIAILDTGFPFYWRAIQRGCIVLIAVGASVILYGMW